MTNAVTGVKITADVSAAERGLDSFASKVQSTARNAIAAYGGMGSAASKAGEGLRGLQAAQGVLQSQFAQQTGLQAQIDAFVAQRKAVSASAAELAAAQAQAQQLSRAFAAAEAPTKRQADAVQRAQANAREAKAAFEGLRAQLQQARSQLAQAGVDTTDLAGAQIRLQRDLSGTSQALAATAAQAKAAAAAQQLTASVLGVASSAAAEAASEFQPLRAAMVSAGGAARELRADFHQTLVQLERLQQQGALMAAFDAQRKSVAAAAEAHRRARDEAERLGRELAATAGPAQRQRAALDEARRAVVATDAAARAHVAELQRLRSQLAQAGVSTDNFAAAQDRLQRALASSGTRLRALADQASAAAAQSQRAAGAAAGGAQGAMAGMLLQARQLALAWVSINSAKGLAGISDQATLAQARLAQVTGGLDGARAASVGLYAMAQRLQVPFGEVVGMFARIMPAVTEMKGGVREATALSEILLSTAKLSGATAQEAASGALQFAQALGSGVLQGDELKSILENNQVLSRELAAALGVPVGRLKELGAQGKLTADVVGNALLSRFDAIKGKAAELPSTVGGAFTQVSNAARGLFTELDRGDGLMAGVARTFAEIARVIEIVSVQLRGAASESARAGQVGGGAAEAIGRGFARVVDIVRAVVSEGRALLALLGGVADASGQLLDGNFLQAGRTLQKSVGDYGRGEGARAEAFGKAVKGDGPALMAYRAQTGLRQEPFDTRSTGRNPATGEVRPAPAKAAGTGGTPATGPVATPVTLPFARLVSGAGPSDAAGSKASKAAPSRMPGWEAELERQKAAHEALNGAQGTFYEFGKAREQAYWQSILGTLGTADRDRLAVARRSYELQLEMRKQDFEGEQAELRSRIEATRSDFAEREMLAELYVARARQRYGEDSKEFQQAIGVMRGVYRQHHEAMQQIDEIRRQGAIEQQLDDVAMLERGAQLERDLGLITQLQLLEIKRAAIGTRWQIEEQAKQAELDAQKGGPNDPVAVEKLEAELAAIRRRYKGEMGGSDGEIRKEKASPMDAVLGSGQQAIEQQMMTMISNLRASWKDLEDVIKSVGATVLQELVVKPFTQWLMTQARMVAMSIGFGTQRVAAEGATAAQISGIQGALSLRNIGASAAEAAANAYKAIAAIPVVGPVLAPAAAAAALVAVVGFGKRVFSASGGFDVPSGMNPLTQLHAEEMVLPAPYAKAIRTMTDQVSRGQEGVRGAAAALPPELHINLSGAMAAREFVMLNRVAIAEAVDRYNKDRLRTRR